jgi:DNA recombination protein RmuC
LFLPAEAFFSSALQADPHLIETAAFQNVIIATPTTLIAILRAVGLSWKQEALSKSTEEIADLGKELYERMAILSEHWSKLGKNIKTVVDSYNTATSSLESRVLSTARKFSSLGSATEKKIKEMSFLEKAPKLFSSEELLDKK